MKHAMNLLVLAVILWTGTAGEPLYPVKVRVVQTDSGEIRAEQSCDKDATGADVWIPARQDFALSAHESLIKKLVKGGKQ